MERNWEELQSNLTDLKLWMAAEDWHPHSQVQIAKRTCKEMVKIPGYVKDHYGDFLALVGFWQQSDAAETSHEVGGVEARER